MSLKLFSDYIELCSTFKVIPTLSGANRFRKSQEIINQLSNEDLQSVLFDVVALL